MQLDVRSLVKQVSIYGVFAILRRSVKFIIIPLYTHYLTPRDFGTLEMLNLVVWFIGILGGGKLDAAFVRYYASTKTDKQKSELFWAALASTACLAGGFCLIGVLNATRILEFMFSSKDLPIIGFYLVLGAVWLELTTAIPFSYLRVTNKAKLVGVLSLTQSLVEAGFSIFLVVFLRIGYLGILYAMMASLLFTFALACKIVVSRVSFSFRFNQVLQMLRYSIPMLPAPFFTYLLTSSDRYFLARFASLDEVGIYSLALKMATVLGLMIMSPFGEMWGPNQFALYEKGEKQVYQNLALLYVSCLFIGSLLVSYLSYEVTAFLFDQKFHRSIEVIVPLSLGVAIWGIVPTMELGCLIRNKTWIRSITTGIAVLVNVSLNMLLIPLYGMFGAALAALSGFIALNLVVFVLNYRLVDFRVEIGKVIPLGCILVIFSLLMYLAPYIPYPFFLLLRLSLLGLYISIILRVNAITVEDLSKFVRKKTTFLLANH
jgi:O-antigen/teichoic acid export membrane protein